MSKKKSPKPDPKELWRKAIKQDDIQLAIDAAKFLGDRERLLAIAVEGWLKGNYEVCEKSFYALGMDLPASDCLQLEEVLKEANGKRRTAIFNIQDVFGMFVTVHNSDSGMIFERSYSSDSGHTVFMAVRLEHSIAVCIRCASRNEFLPNEIWPEYFKEWHYKFIENYNSFKKWAKGQDPNFFLPLLPLNEQKQQKEPSFVAKVIAEISKNGWHGLSCMAKLQPEFLQLNTVELEKIRKKLQHLDCCYDTQEPLKKFPLSFANALSVGGSKQGIAFAKSNFIENVRCLHLSKSQNSIYKAFFASVHLKNVEKIVFDYLPEMPIDTIKSSPWLKKIKKLSLGCDTTKGGIKQIANLLQTFSATEDVEIYLEIDKAVGTALATLQNLQSIYSRGEIKLEGVKEFLKGLKPKQLKRMYFDFANVSKETLLELLSSPKLEDFEELEFIGIENADIDVIKVLANSKHFSNLKKLTMSYCSNGQSFIAPILQSPYLKNLRQLELTNNNLSDETIVALANSPNMPKLEELTIDAWNNNDLVFAAFARSPYFGNLRKFTFFPNKITIAGIKALNENSFPNLCELELLKKFGKRIGVGAGKWLAQWPRLAQLELLNVDELLDKKARQALCAVVYLQGVELKGIPEYQGVTNWRNMGKSEEIYTEIMVLGQKQEIIVEAKKQIGIWAAKFKIYLDFVKQESADCICISMIDIGKTIFSRAKKNSYGEPDISDREYAISLVEEAKRKIADKYQEQITQIFFQGQEQDKVN